jgi:ATP-dependent DNA helicase RecG
VPSPTIFQTTRRPGVVFVGVNDEGSCANAVIDDELLLRLANMRSDVLPFPMLVVQKKVVRG